MFIKYYYRETFQHRYLTILPLSVYPDFFIVFLWLLHTDKLSHSHSISSIEKFSNGIMEYMHMYMHYVLTILY